jgi:hypothetical protein
MDMYLHLKLHDKKYVGDDKRKSMKQLRNKSSTQEAFHILTFNDPRYFYRPGMKYAMLSRILLSNSCGQPLVSGTCWVKHIKGPRAHSSESSSTDKLPDTAIWPYKRRKYITKAVLQVWWVISSILNMKNIKSVLTFIGDCICQLFSKNK